MKKGGCNCNRPDVVLELICRKSVDFLVCLIATHLTDSVLEHHVLLEEVVNGNLVLGVVVHRALEEEAQEALSAITAGTACKVDEQTQVKAQGCCKNRVAAQEVDLDLHGIAHPAKDVDVVPSLLVVVAGRVVVNAYLVEVVVVQVGLIFSNEDGLEGRELADLLGAEVGGLVKHEAVAVAQDVGREPAVQTEHAGADDGSETALNEGLAGLEVLTGDGHMGLLGHLPHGGDVDGGVGSTHDEGAILGQGGVSIAPISAA